MTSELQLKSIDMPFEKMVIGAKFTSARRTITETDLVSFSGLSGDFSPIHIDDVYAQESPFGGRIAHGALLFSIATGLEFPLVSPAENLIAFYGMNRVRFIRPVLIGTTIKLVGEITELKERDAETGIVTFHEAIVTEAGETCAVWDKLQLCRRLPVAAQD
jgi:3-hydroxybutyryl-CoA dehydratase